MKKEKLVWHTEKRKIDDLVPFNGNPRRMTDQQRDDLTLSLERFNLVEIPAIDGNTILAGHQRLKILQDMGRGGEEIEVRVPNRKLTKKEQKEYLLRSNKNLGEWNWDLLAEFDEELLKGVGFDSQELDKIFFGKEEKDPDDVPDIREECSIKIGDLFKLGEHRLLCGDAKREEDVTILMGKSKADIIITDPPYNVNYSGRGKETSRKIKNDNLTKEAFNDLLNKSFKHYHLFSKENAPLYTCYASVTHREFENALNNNNYIVKNQIIWVKLVASMGWGDYRWKHEPIFYAHQKKEPVDSYGDRKEYTEWSEELTDEKLLKKIKRMIEKEEKGGSTVWRLNRDREYKHPTQKPVQLINIALLNSSKREEIVIDYFGGSGTVLISSESLNRKCYMMELEPSFVQVIIDRWQEFTGKKAEYVGNYSALPGGSSS